MPILDLLHAKSMHRAKWPSTRGGVRCSTPAICPRRDFGRLDHHRRAIGIADVDRMDRVPPGRVGNPGRPEQPRRRERDLVRPRRPREPLAGRFQERLLASPEPEERVRPPVRVGLRDEALATNVEAGRDQHQVALAREYSVRSWHPGGMEPWRRMIHRRDVSARSLRVRAVVLITLFVAACGGSGGGAGSGSGSPDAGADVVTIGWTQAAITTPVTTTVGAGMPVRWRSGDGVDHPVVAAAP